MLQITPAAASKVRSLLEAQGKLGSHALRVRVAGGGCSGFQYEMFFDDARDEMDAVVAAADDVEVRVDPMSATYLKGSRLDFLDTLNESGFKIDNPNAVSECGCGKSFAA